MPLTAKLAEISLVMNSGRIWKGKVDLQENLKDSGNSSLKRAEVIFEERLSSYAYDPDEPSAAVFADMFAFFKALAGVTALSPVPDFDSVRTRSELMDEASTWLNFVWSALGACYHKYNTPCQSRT